MQRSPSDPRQWIPRYVEAIAVVQFLDYRRHDQARVAANNSIMALLAGAHLASHSLQLTEGSDLLLPQIYPQVPHIKRFNLLSSHARTLLRDAEEHLGAMAVPYVLAIHQDFVEGSLRLLGHADRVSASNMHRELASVAQVTGGFGPPLSSYHAARILRNAVIHSGGRWDAQCASEAQRDVDPAPCR